MRTKNFLRIGSLFILMAITLPAISNSMVSDSSQTNSAVRTEDLRAQQLVQRLEDIKGMNKSEMTKMEKKNLRKEVKEIKKEMKKSKTGVYLSVGALIIIILLLILLL